MSIPFERNNLHFFAKIHTLHLLKNSVGIKINNILKNFGIISFQHFQPLP